MSVTDDDLWRLEHIIECIEKLEEFYEKAGNIEVFITNHLYQSAAERELFKIGEATIHLSADLKQQASETEWNKIKGLRNILAHEYFSVDPREVWLILENRVPNFKEVIKKLHQLKKE